MPLGIVLGLVDLGDGHRAALEADLPAHILGVAAALVSLCPKPGAVRIEARHFKPMLHAENVRVREPWTLRKSRGAR